MPSYWIVNVGIAKTDVAVVEVTVEVTVAVVVVVVSAT